MANYGELVDSVVYLELEAFFIGNGTGHLHVGAVAGIRVYQGHALVSSA